VVAVDWPNVVPVARENAAKAGLEHRFEAIGGSAFDVDFGDRYDLALITNFLHHFNRTACIEFLRKVHGALTKGGRVMVLDFVPNDDRVAPPAAAQFVLTMLAATPDGDAYTFAEFSQMLEAAGFRSSAIYPLPPSPYQVIIAEK
jgi:cyclopropane fatty-acyl-phospholipid synthase-like methyltransferase